MRKYLSVILLIPLALVVWLPFYMLLTGVIMDSNEAASYLAPALTGAKGFVSWPILPRYPTFKPLISLLLDTPAFFRMFWLGCAMTFPAVGMQVLFSAPAAWALAKMRFPGRKALWFIYIALMLLPFQVTMVPSFIVLSKLNLLNTVWAVILPSAFTGLPVFVMCRCFTSIPRAFLDAASIDGAGPVRTFFHIGLPLGAPGIMSVVVLGIIECWNAIEPPVTFIRDQGLWPLSLFLSNIAGEDAGAAFSASIMSMLPAVLVFLWGREYLESGIRQAGLKE